MSTSLNIKSYLDRPLNCSPFRSLSSQIAVNARPISKNYQARVKLELFVSKLIFTTSLIQQYVGIDESEAVKRLKSLLRKYKWKTKQDPQNPQAVRYLPARPGKSVSEQNPAN